MKVLYFFAVLFLGLFSKTTISQENKTPTSPFAYTQVISLKLSELEKLTPEEFLTEVDQYRNELEKYFNHKKRVCNGEFSTIILSEAGERSEGGEQLSKRERKLCFREMKALKTTFINNMYKSRKRYLESLHSKRIEDLDASREKALKELNATFSEVGAN